MGKVGEVIRGERKGSGAVVENRRGSKRAPGNGEMGWALCLGREGWLVKVQL